MPAIPRNFSAKKLEVPVRKLLLGQPLEKVINRDVLADPASLDWFIDFAARASGEHDEFPPLAE